MKGIALLNPAYSIGELSKKESFLIQKILLKKLIDQLKITQVRLNPYQIKDYYTIPHALLHDLEVKQLEKLDCLLLYSLQTMERFQYIYPEKWEKLSANFSRIVTVNEMGTGSSYNSWIL